MIAFFLVEGDHFVDRFVSKIFRPRSSKKALHHGLASIDPMIMGNNGAKTRCKDTRATYSCIGFSVIPRYKTWFSPLSIVVGHRGRFYRSHDLLRLFDHAA